MSIDNKLITTEGKIMKHKMYEENRAQYKSTHNHQETCANCSMPQKDWSGVGYVEMYDISKAYCCKGCAEGTGCTCEEDEVDDENNDYGF